ncbi:MAG TPA: Calx-beta domain-containing protein, partial [Prosthecobacter sp.]
YVIWGFNSNNYSQLIDASTPGSNAFDASLNVGSTLRDDAAGIVMRVEAAGGSGLDEYLDIRVTQANRVYPLQTVYDVDEAAGSLTIQLARSGEPNETTIVRVATQDGTAVAPSDYTTVSTTVRWDGTDISPKSVSIPIIANATRELAENFKVNITLEQGVSMSVAGSPVTVNIREPGMSDATFVHDTFLNSGGVRSLAVEPDGSIAFGGGTFQLGSATVNGIGRVGSQGQTDTSFNRLNGAFPLPVLAMARQPDGKFLVGGSFTSLRSVLINRVGRLENDGGIDTSFDPGAGADSTVRAIAVQPNGCILVGGDFLSFDGTPRRGLARLMPDGALDESFMAVPLPVSTMQVQSIVLQPDGKILVGGLIHTAASGELFSGLSSGVLRLNADGTVDSSFDIGAGAHLLGDTGSPQRVMTLALQYDGKVLVGGSFTGFQGGAAPRIARLNSNGSLDAAFQSALGTDGANALVRSLEVQGDGRILVAGDFTVLGGSLRSYVGRLLASGALDTNFDIQLPLSYPGGSPNIVYQTRMQQDAKILVAVDAPGTGDTTLRRVFSGQLGRSGTVEFSSGSVAVNEGGQAVVEVRRSGGSLGEVSVSYDVRPGSASAADHSPVSGRLTWAAGDMAPKTFVIQAVADSEAEETEYFDIQLGVPLGGVSLGERAVTTVAIADPGAAGFATISFTSDATTMEESSTVSQTLTVELSAAAQEVITVPLVLGGKATNAGVGTNGDYNIQTELPLRFQPGQTAKTVV